MGRVLDWAAGALVVTDHLGWWREPNASDFGAVKIKHRAIINQHLHRQRRRIRIPLPIKVRAEVVSDNSLTRTVGERKPRIHGCRQSNVFVAEYAATGWPGSIVESCLCP